MNEAVADRFGQLFNAHDPAPILHALRREDPVYFVSSLGFWLVTRHDDVKRLFNDPENVTQDRRAWEHFVPQPEGTLMRQMQDRSVASQGPEAHTRFRRLFSGALTPRAVRRMDAQIREVVERFARPLRGRPGEILDLMGDFTEPIPNTVISRVTGVPPGQDEVRFRELAQSIIRAFFPFAPPEAMTRGEAALQEMAAWVREMTAERRRAPCDDLVSDLIRSQEQDARLTDDDVVMLISVMLGAGSDTTNLGGSVLIRTLLGHPGQMERVRNDRTLLPRAVNELLRFSFGGPAGIQRYAVRDFELREKQIRKGQMLMLSFGGANRDPAVFEDPDVLDFDRKDEDLLVFGNGPHYCLGANLARQELGCMLDAALDIAPPGSRVREDLVEFQQMGLFKRPRNLPVEIPGSPLSRTADRPPAVRPA
jgi:cytochrome P450